MAHLTDSATSITFPATLCDEAPVTCMGVGVRTKRIAMIDIKAYSVGLYVDVAEAQAALASFTPSAGLAKDESFYAALMGLNRKYLHLIFARDVPSKKVVETFTSLAGVPKPVVTEFADMLAAALHGDVPKGQSITLGTEGGRLIVSVGGQPAGEVADAVLPAKVFDLFLGAKSVAPAAKTAIASGLPVIMAAA